MPRGDTAEQSGAPRTPLRRRVYALLEPYLLWLWKVLPIPLRGRRAYLELTHPRFLLGVMALIRDDQGRVLILEHTYRRNHVWGLPGGYQAYSLRLRHYKKHESAVFQEQMRRVDLPIVSDQWVVPADLASWYPRRALWLPRSTTDLERIFENLRRSAQPRMLVVAREGSALDRYMQDLAARGRLREESREPVRSRLFHYTGLSAVVYGTSP